MNQMESRQNKSKNGPMLRTERRDDGILVVWVDVPGETVNTLRRSFADDFARVFDEIDRDESLVGVVLASAKPDNFIAGADISMLSQVQSEEEAVGLSRVGQQAVDRISECQVPVVAAIHGSCLGGGLEVALAAQGRVASGSPKTKLGLPEVQLGILPGMGGTQRLVSLIGLQSGLDLLLTGRQLNAHRARKVGLVDEIVPASICVQVAAERALQLGRGSSKSRSSLSALRDLLDAADLREMALAENPIGRKVVFDQAKKRLLEKTQGNYPAPEKILEVVRTGLRRGFRSGLEAESEAFGQLVVSKEARALRHVYFSQQALKKSTGTASEVEPRALSRVGVLGAGLMGSGIAYVSTQLAGASVRLKDVSEEGIQAGLSNIHKLLSEQVKRRKISQREAEQILARVTRTTDYSGFEGLDLVIEAVFEDLELKRRVLADVESSAGRHTIFASNTSSLPIGDIAKNAKHEDRVVGMHYFSPVHKMPLLEIITTEHTADWVTASCVALGKKQGKTVIVVRDGPGFYTTRILGPYLNEAAFALVEGYSVASVDQALVEHGFPVGPLALLDEVGIDVGAKVAETLQKAFGKRVAPPAQLAHLHESGRQGRKNKSGFYDYEHTGRGKRPADETVYGDLGLDQNELHDASDGERTEIAERCLLSMVNEAVHCLGDGVLSAPRDGDVGAIFGLGFPPFRGGPFHYIDSRGAGKVLSQMRQYEAQFGERFTPAPLLVEMAEKEKKFY